MLWCTVRVTGQLSVRYCSHFSCCSNFSCTIICTATCGPVHMSQKLHVVRLRVRSQRPKKELSCPCRIEFPSQERLIGQRIMSVSHPHNYIASPRVHISIHRAVSVAPLAESYIPYPSSSRVLEAMASSSLSPYLLILARLLQTLLASMRSRKSGTRLRIRRRLGHTCLDGASSIDISDAR